MRWYLAASVSVVVVVLAVLLAPMYALVTVAVIAALAVFFLRPKLAAGISVVGILFGSGLATSTGVDILGYLDEALVLLPLVVFTVLRLAEGKRLRILPGWGWLAAYVALGLASGFVHEVPLELAGQSSFLMLKGFILAFGIAQLDWTADDVRKFVKPAAWVIGIVLFLSVINLAIPEVWAGIFSRRSTGVDYRLGLPSLIGPFDHEFAYGQFMALAAVAVLAYRTNIGKSWASAVLLTGAVIGSILSFRRKAISAMLAALFTARLVSPGKRLGTALSFVLVLPVAVIVGWEGISTIVGATYDEYFAGSTEAARTILYRDSVMLATSAFPLGVGFGRFGSYLAGQNYSPEYVALGYQDIYGLAPGIRGTYLSDTFWPAVIGESGWLGLAAFALSLVVLARQGLKLIRTSEDAYVRLAGVVLVGWMLEFTIESIAAPVFNTPPLFALLFGLAGVVVSLVAQQSPAEPLSVTRVRPQKQRALRP